MTELHDSITEGIAFVAGSAISRSQAAAISQAIWPFVEEALAAKDTEIDRIRRDMDIRDEGPYRKLLQAEAETTRANAKAAEYCQLYQATADQLHAAESSRRDWAAEAMRLDRELERRADLLHSIWLYVDWRKVTRQLTTEQKDMWADAVEAFSEVLEPGDPAEADRWWRDPAFSRPVRAVHEEGQ